MKSHRRRLRARANGAMIAASPRPNTFRASEGEGTWGRASFGKRKRQEQLGYTTPLPSPRVKMVAPMMALPLVVLGVSTAPLTLKLRVDPPELAHPFAEAAATLVDDDGKMSPLADGQG